MAVRKFPENDMRCLTLLLLWLLLGCIPPAHAQTRDWQAPRIEHVFIIMLENQLFDTTFGKDSPAPYLARDLTAKCALLRQYFAIGHLSLPNYIAMISGQAPNPATQRDCTTFSEFLASGPLDADGQLPGEGCVYPDSVRTIADQLDAAGKTWKGYMEDMGNDPARAAAECGHSPIGAEERTRHATAHDMYVAKHNPFVYFHSIIDDHQRCRARVVNLKRLDHDLRTLATTPNYSYITPNLCHDGHDAPCKNGEPGGLISADRFLRHWVPRIMASAAYKQGGLIVITFDEATMADKTSCCATRPLPGGPEPGLGGPGGGRIGALLLSPHIGPGTISDVPYNHYSLLRWSEDNFGLAPLGHAGTPGLVTFGSDVFTQH